LVTLPARTDQTRYAYSDASGVLTSTRPSVTNEMRV
jgi:hypothetical protein